MAALGVIGALAGVEKGITLAIEVGGQLVPLVKGAIAGIKQIGAGTDTVSYEILISTDQSELNKVIAVSTDDLNAINAELARMGKPPLEIPK